MMVFHANPGTIDAEVAKHRIPFQLTDPQQQKLVEDVLSVFNLSGETILKVADIFTQQIENGLRYDDSSPLPMQNTFVHSLLDGTEEGKYLALDLGGSNFRVLLVELSEGKLVREEIGKYEVSEKQRTGCGTDLFDHLAKCTLDFATKHGVARDNLPLGFTFSFPMAQSSLDSGTLTLWIGQYNVSGVVGCDVVNMLREAIARTKSLNVEVVAILNDTTGVLLRGSLIDKETAISFILGTGSNACYIEKTSRMAGWTGPEKEAVLNIEWGPFPDKGDIDFIQTKYDKEVDENSLHPKCYLLEKYIGGEFLGETVRLVLCDLIDKGVLFEGNSCGILREKEAFKSSYVSEIEKDNLEKESKRTEKVLKELNVTNFSEDDRKILKFVCEAISIRMSLLSSALLGEIVKRIDRPRITIAVDGSVYKYHPRIHNYLTHFTNVFVGSQQAVKFILAEDGSGTGAALLAAKACKRQSTHL